MKNCIIVPCYNEELRLPANQFLKNLSENKDLFFCFVNDGSSDDTINVLTQIKIAYPDNVLIVDEKENKGKASAVFRGFNEVFNWQEFDTIGYLDADLATSIEEYQRLSSYVKGDVSFVFGSRIRRIGANIKRKLYRHLIGRVFATISSQILDLPVYDTQCGAKVFASEMAKKIFKEPFISNWSFDVEIFFKFSNIVKKSNVERLAKEIPLEEWRDVGDSKVKFSYSFKLPFELLRIRRYYKKTRNIDE